MAKDRQSAVLKYYVNILRKQRADCAYLSFLVDKILPLLRKVFPSVVDCWLGNISSYLKKSDELKMDILPEVKTIFASIKRGSAGERIGRGIREQIMNLEALVEWSGVKKKREKFWKPSYEIIDGKPKIGHVMPGQHVDAVDRLRQLCCSIVRAGRRDIVEPYATIREADEYVEDEGASLRYRCLECFKQVPEQILVELVKLSSSDDQLICPTCGSMLASYKDRIIKKCSYIQSFDEKVFVPSYFKLDDLKTSFWGSPAAAWWTLCRIELALDDQRDYFRKDLHYNSPQECERSARLLHEHAMRAEVLAVKNKRQGRNKVPLFKRALIEKALQMVLNAVGHQKISSKTSKVFPYAIELRLYDDINLSLYLHWCSGLIERFHLHTYDECKKMKAFKFIKKLLDNPGVEVWFLKKKKGVKAIKDRKKGAKAIKYIKRSGIDGVLFDLFVEKTATYSAIIKATYILLSDYREPVRKRLLKHVNKLKKSRWLS